MQIVIDIPDEIYKDIESRDWKNSIWARDSLMRYIHEGVVLPKHHGRLIDERKITRCEQVGLVIKDDNVTRCLVTDAPTIIEATEEVQE